MWTGVKIASNGYGWLLAIELTQMTCFWTQVRSTWRALFKRRKARFVVTSKRGRQSNSILRHISPQIVYIAGSAIAICWAAARYRLNLSHDLIGLTIGSALLFVNSYLAWVVIRRALRSKDRRSAWRHPVALHVDYRTLTPSGDVLSGQCVTRDINEGGIGLVSFDQLPDKAELALTISAAGRSVACRGVVRSQVAAIHFHSRHNPAAQAFVYGVEYLHLDKDQLDTLWWMGAQFAVGLHYERFSGGQFGLGSVEARKLPACKTESAFELPVTLTFSEKQTVVAVTESIGPETMTLLLPEESRAARSDSSENWELRSDPSMLRSSIVESKSRTLAGCTVRETRFRFRQVSPVAGAHARRDIRPTRFEGVGPGDSLDAPATAARVAPPRGARDGNHGNCRFVSRQLGPIVRAGRCRAGSRGSRPLSHAGSSRPSRGNGRARSPRGLRGRGSRPAAAHRHGCIGPASGGDRD